MYNRIIELSMKAADEIEAEIIPTGSVIQKIRRTIDEFDYENGGLSLCRDGFHLSLDYGRYAAAATWIRKLCQRNVAAFQFGDFDLELLQKIVKVVNSVR